MPYISRTAQNSLFRPVLTPPQSEHGMEQKISLHPPKTMNIAELELKIRRIRQTIFDLPDGEAEQAGQELERLKELLCRAREVEDIAAPRGPYSGMTKRQLTLSGTCEADWF